MSRPAWHKGRPYLKNNQRKKGLWNGCNGRALSPEKCLWNFSSDQRKTSFIGQKQNFGE
jgi:hypothetical protein